MERRLRERIHEDPGSSTTTSTPRPLSSARRCSNALEIGRGARSRFSRSSPPALGAAAIACLNLLVTLGAKRENIWVCDIEGVVYEGRETLMDPYKSVYAQRPNARTLG